MPKHRTAIISDIHVGPHSRSPELRGTGEIAPTKSYIEYFKSFTSENSITADSLVIAGDLTCYASPSEFAIASEFILSVSKLLSVDNSNIFFVPGNHDLNWAVCELSRDKDGNKTNGLDEKFWTGKSFSPIADQELIFSERLAESSSNLLTPPHYCTWQTDELLVLAVNSAAYDFPWNRPHNGKISQDSISQIDAELSKIPSQEKKLRMALVHHHPILLDDPLPHWNDYSALKNAESFTELLAKHGFDFVIHGHKHNPKVKVLSDGYRKPLVLVGAGSFSVTLESDLSGIINNQFHIIETEGRSPDSSAFGIIKNWAFLANHGWKKSEKHNGIIHEFPFGKYGNLRELALSIVPIIDSELSIKNYVEWTTICDKKTELKYINHDRVLDIMKISSKKTKLKFKILKENEPEEMILIKVDE